MEVTNVTEYEAIAKQKLPKMVYDYYASAAEDQRTLQQNRNAFARILLRLEDQWYSHLLLKERLPVRKVLQMLRDEFELTMALSGCRSLSEITCSHIITEWDTPSHLPKL